MFQTIKRVNRRYRRLRGNARANRHVKVLIEPSQPIEKNRLILVCSVVDGMLYFPTFLKHYRKLGVTQFIFYVDPKTKDDSVEVLAMEPDVMVLIDGSGGTEGLEFYAVRALMMRRYALNQWTLFVDIDEFFDYPESDALPMHGLIAELFVATGDTVEPGDRLLILEAMKMQHEINASIAGQVRAVHTSSGSQIAAGALILEIEETS